MSYYSEYDLKILKSENKKEELKIIDNLRKSCRNAKNSFTECGESDSSLQWYSLEEDICKFSKNYPNLIFVIERHGEHREDIERIVFKNGKYKNYSAKLVFEGYNEEEIINNF